MGGTRMSGREEEGSTEAAPSTGRANTCAGDASREVRRRQALAGHASQARISGREEEGGRIRAFRATGG